MDTTELSSRLRALHHQLHVLANPPFKIGIGEMKREIRAIRDQIGQLGEETTSDPKWLRREG